MLLSSTPLPPPSSEPRVEVVDLDAGYDGRTVLHGVSARFRAGEVTVVSGPNGSGKSTLVAVLAGALLPSSGIVERVGIRRVAYVPQQSAVPSTLPLTVGEAVRMGRWSHRGMWRRLTAGDRVIVDDALEAMDLGALASMQLGSLSGGQRQRALVAQGLAQRADLVLLDEPSAGLDSGSRGLIRTALQREASRGAVVLHVTHDPDEISAAASRLDLPDPSSGIAGREDGPSTDRGMPGSTGSR